MNKVLMVQTNKYQWQIQSEKGHVIQTDISLNDVRKAKEFIKAWVSSFNTPYFYEVVPMKEDSK